MDPVDLDRDVSLDRKIESDSVTGAKALFYRDGTLALFALEEFQRVGLDGTLLSAVPYQDPGGDKRPARARNAVAGPSQFAVVLQGGFPQNVYLCLLNADGSVNTQSCRTMYENDARLVPVSWSAAGVLALTIIEPNGGTLHCQLFDSNLQLLRESDLLTHDPLFRLNPGTRGGFVTTATNLGVMCTGIDHQWFDPNLSRCQTAGVTTFPSDLDPSQVASRNLLRPDVQALFGCKAASSGDRVALVYSAACYWLNGTGRCQDFPPTAPSQSYVTIIDGSGNPVVTSKPSSMPSYLRHLFWDGTRFVAIFMDINRARIWAFDRDGNFLLENVDLPVIFNDEIIDRVSGSTAVTAVGPNDYVMVYGAYPARGFETRMVRFSLPPPP